MKPARPADGDTMEVDEVDEVATNKHNYPPRKKSRALFGYHTNGVPVFPLDNHPDLTGENEVATKKNNYPCSSADDVPFSRLTVILI